jgi:gamma-glutamyltranspeptidase/glutathione hydrolase
MPRLTRGPSARRAAAVLTAGATVLALTAAGSAPALADGHGDGHGDDHGRHDHDHGHDRGRHHHGHDRGRYNVKTPTSVGYGGAVSSVDPEASRIGIEVLRRGGNAVDAAVATAAALGVTEPFSSGIGGGGYFVYYDAGSGEVQTIDGRETAPAAMPHDAFMDPDNPGEPYNFYPERVTSGVAVGVPGTLATWETALEEWGTRDLDDALRPAMRLAQRGFIVDETFHQQVEDNRERFEAFTPTARLYLPDGEAPETGSVFRNRALAHTYRLIAHRGTDVFYEGRIAEEIADAVTDPPTSDTTHGLPMPPGYMTTEDLADYEALVQDPTRSDFRGYDVYGMAPSSSGGSTVGESLNILEQVEPTPAESDLQGLHDYFESTALAYADRAKYLGDEAFVDVPLDELLADDFAAERSCAVDPETSMPRPVAAGEADGEYDTSCDGSAPRSGTEASDTESISTTNLTVSDRWGNVVEYTLTIEQIGGSGIVVPGRGFLLNNELTDFSAVYDESDPNRIEGGKRPRSSMSPTIVLEDGEPFVALGSPGGSTIITTVSQMLFNRIDRDMSIEQAHAAPRASERNAESGITAEPEFLATYGQALREAYGQKFGEPMVEIGAATAIEFGRHGTVTAVSEPERRGGGSALVVAPRGRHHGHDGRDHDGRPGHDGRDQDGRHGDGHHDGRHGDRHHR